MTRIYRYYMDQGISERLLDYIRNDIMETSVHGGRFTPTNFVRATDFAYFDFEYIVLADGTETFDPLFGIEEYYISQLNHLKALIKSKLEEIEKIFDSGDVRLATTHMYNIED